MYGKLLEAGVEIHEYKPTMLHQKTMIVDGAWATVSAANFDNRSFALNAETNICFHDPKLVKRLEEIFEADLSFCKQVGATDWQKRGTWQRTREVMASLVEEQM
jgi:cardiolipin synthase A/B